MKHHNNKVKILDFQTLWENHPTVTGDDYPCSTGITSDYPNQCAIRMIKCLEKSGIDTARLPGVAHCQLSEHDNMGHSLKAEELSTGLSRCTIEGIQKVRKIKPENFSTGLHGKTGIIFIKNFRQTIVNDKKEIFRNISGDHIDLWNGSMLTSLTAFHQIMQQAGIGIYNHYNNDELKQNISTTIWFWRVP